MIKDFQSFINEAITLKREGGEHYLERANTRLAKLEVIGFINTKGEKVEATSSDISQTQQFFREALSNIADPDKSQVFSDTDIKPGYIGIIRLGRPKVTLTSGKEALPVFRVYERTDKSTGKEVLRTGTCFWIFTIGSQVSTIKLYDVDGNKPSEKAYLINKSIEHMLADREAELAKISRVFSIKLDSKEELEKRHSVILTPAGISIIHLNISSGDSRDQLDEFINKSTVSQQETFQLIPDPNRESSFSLETVPRQMNVTPDKVWLLERNEKFNTWGAMPIVQSRQIKGATGNEIAIKLGKKWLHWLEKPVFNTPIQIDRVIKKGDKVTLAKEMGSGDWLVNIGTVTDIAIDSRASEFPYVRTGGWDTSFIINREDAANIFVDSRQVSESLNQVLSFSEWSRFNLR